MWAWKINGWNLALRLQNTKMTHETKLSTIISYMNESLVHVIHEHEQTTIENTRERSVEAYITVIIMKYTQTKEIWKSIQKAQDNDKEIDLISRKVLTLSIGNTFPGQRCRAGISSSNEILRICKTAFQTNGTVQIHKLL